MLFRFIRLNLTTSQDKTLLDIQLQKKLWDIAVKPPLKSEYLIIPEWKEPVDVQKKFSKETDSFCLELGSGWGEVAIELAKNNPSTGFILMEKRKDRIQETVHKIINNKLNNITPQTIRKGIRKSLEDESTSKKIARQMVKEDEAEYVTQEYIRELEEEMLQAASELNFEKAAEIRDRVIKLQSEAEVEHV